VAVPFRGEIWDADLDPTRGHEQGGRRPVLVISIDSFNKGPAKLISVVPLTRRERGLLMHVKISPPEGGLPNHSFAMCENLRAIALERFGRRWGSISEQILRAVEGRVRILLGL
jgi:mRNA interferase MazF